MVINVKIEIGVRFTELKFGIKCSQVELGLVEGGGIMPIGAQPADEFKSRLSEALERLIHQG